MLSYFVVCVLLRFQKFLFYGIFVISLCFVSLYFLQCLINLVLNDTAEIKVYYYRFVDDYYYIIMSSCSVTMAMDQVSPHHLAMGSWSHDVVDTCRYFSLKEQEVSEGFFNSFFKLIFCVL